MARLWTCPYCNRHCTLQEADVKIHSSWSYLSKEYDDVHSSVEYTICPNPECRQLSINLWISKYDRSNQRTAKLLYQWNLLPESEAKPFPEYIPKALLEDYKESCLIKNKSPKASATLSRRCLQGMIRDFWGIKKKRLFDEIAALEETVDDQTWQAIDAVRKVGNIGAHMEADVNLIIDVDPEEAALLIWLIETLFEEWYIKRYEKDQKMQKIIELATKKTDK